jgi:hypothetical protein
LIYADASADGLSLKDYDNSGNSWAETTIITDGSFVDDTTDGTGQYPFSGAVRHSDGKIILAAWTHRDLAATGDFRVFEIGTGSVVEKTAIATDTDDSYYPSLMVDCNDVIWVGYNGHLGGAETLGTTTSIYYTKSVDGATTWNSKNTTYSVTAATNNLQVWGPRGGPRFILTWRDGTLNDLLTNADNSHAIKPCVPAGKGIIGG